tara:strand:- start:4856 stop:5221 length:366 start_codon:yes stop_codon:yes gene_type:complete
MLSKLILVFVGGGLGSSLRYFVNIYSQELNYSQSGTVFVNVFGSFLFGLIFVILGNKTSFMNIFLLTGVLGGFTTFSQFSFDVIQLQHSSNLISIMYVLFSLFLSILALCIGIYLGNKIFN